VPWVEPGFAHQPARGIGQSPAGNLLWPRSLKREGSARGKEHAWFSAPGSAKAQMVRQLTSIGRGKIIRGRPPLHDKLSAGSTTVRKGLWRRAELNSKRIEVLHEIAPKIRRVAVIANPLHAGEASERADLQAKANQLDIELIFFPTPNRMELERALAAMADDVPQAIIAFSDGFVIENRTAIIDFAMSRHLPLVSGWAVMAKSGALCTYGPRLVESYRRTAYFVDRILNGARPVELPIEEPTILDLVVNVKTAKALGIEVPSSVLARADEVIE
jgi:hypothetical protein